MDRKTKVLAVNPGSTSTKIALFADHDELFRVTIDHPAEELKRFGSIQEQLSYRREAVERTLAEKGYSLSDVDVFSARGGSLYSTESGTYKITELLVEHASMGVHGEHSAQLASQICYAFAQKLNKPAFIVNPPDCDEFQDISRITGIKGVYRESHIHALNQKEVAARFCRERGLKYEDVNLVIAHLGGGISVTAHQKGRMIDSNDIIKGSGPMTPTRAGDLAYMDVINMAFSGEYTKKQLTDKLNREGGLTDHFGTADARDIVKMIEAGDKYAEAVAQGMAYQNAKYIGAMAVAMKGDVNEIILTGGIGGNKYFTGIIKDYVSWISEVTIMPGEFELEVLAASALRVMRGEEETKIYSGIPIWRGFED